MGLSLLVVARPAAGGMAGHLRTICSGLDPAQYTITLACPNTDAAVPGIDRIDLPVADKISIRRDVQIIRQLRALMRCGKYDLVHVHGLKASLLAAVAARSAAVPLVVTLHNTLPRPRSRLRRSGLDSVLRWVFKPAHQVVVVSQAQAADLRGRKLSACPVQVVPNGIDIKQFPDNQGRSKMRSSIGVDDEDFMVLTVARLIAGKGLDDLLEAARTYRGEALVRFIVVGDGPEKERLTEKVAQLGLQKQVRFLGFRSDVPKLLGAADAYLLPSHAEGLPLSILEAMAAEVPVIATSVGGIPELVVHEQTGLLVRAHQPQEIRAAIDRLRKDERLRRALAEEGRLLVEAKFSNEHMLAALGRVYDAAALRYAAASRRKE